MTFRNRPFSANFRAPSIALLLALSLSATVSAQIQLKPAARYTDSNVSSTLDREQQFAALAQEASIFERQNSLLRNVVRLASPTIVHIEATKEAASEGSLTSNRVETKRIDEAGAGVIVQIGSQHYVLTNRHVVYPAKLAAIKIELADHSSIRPTNFWSDQSTDVAVLEIQTAQSIPARIGNSDTMDIGDSVLAVGSPFGLSHSVTYGIISAKGRRNLDLGSRSIEIQDFLQTDAAINPGNSGGPMINMRGEVIGINTAIASNSGGSEGIGFAIPINMAMAVATQLIEKGNLQRAYLGVQMENAYDAAKSRRLGLDRPLGALVKVVKPKSPAEQAGLQVGDVILEFDGMKIENDGHLVQTVGLTPVGKNTRVIIYRNGQTFEAIVKLTEMPRAL